MPTPRLNIVLSSDRETRQTYKSFIARHAELTTASPDLTEALLRTLGETGRVDGVVMFADDADAATIALAKHVDTHNIPYLLVLGKCSSAQVLFELASREFILISRESPQIEATINRFFDYLVRPEQKYRGPTPAASRLPGDIWVKQGYGDRRIALDDIRSISADKDYALIELPNASLLVRETLTTLEEELSAQDFIRIHRSHIVPARRIREVKNATRHSHQVLLEDGEVFPVGKTYWPLLRKRLRRETA